MRDALARRTCRCVGSHLLRARVDASRHVAGASARETCHRTTQRPVGNELWRYKKCGSMWSAGAVLSVVLAAALVPSAHAQACDIGAVFVRLPAPCVSVCATYTTVIRRRGTSQSSQIQLAPAVLCLGLAPIVASPARPMLAPKTVAWCSSHSGINAVRCNLSDATATKHGWC